jgi:aspartate/methionine/tyrosine aminotransferase
MIGTALLLLLLLLLVDILIIIIIIIELTHTHAPSSLISKSHSMTGYRIGYSCAPLRISKAISKLQSQITSCASSISQHAAHFALTSMPQTNPGWMADRVGELQAKRDLAYTLLHSIPGVTCPKPMGAFYLLPDVSCYYGKRLPPLPHGTSELLDPSSSSSSPSIVVEEEEGVIVSDSHVLCVQLLRREGVALVPGEAFGAPATVRISYAASSEVIAEAIHRLQKFLVSLQ